MSKEVPSTHNTIHRFQLGEPVIDNIQSIARDQFATERTFLAWIKLALGIASSASSIVSSFPKGTWIYTKMIEIITIVFVVISIIIVILSTGHMLENQRKLAMERSPVQLFRPIFLEVVFAIIAVTMAFVLALSY